MGGGPAAERAPGDRLGPYALVRPLGAGGMGEVWEAVLHGPAGFRKPVALKLLRVGPVDPVARAALVHEARLGALVQHPHVVATLALTEHAGTWCVALELVRGLPVPDLIRAHGRLPGGAVLEIGVHAAAGLQHVHELVVDGGVAGLVHRDVKPSNLLVDRTGLVKLADLGISALGGQAAGVAGTPGYMAPEQARGVPEPRSDLFALGATLFVLATGRRPFGKGAAAMREVARVEDHLRDPSFLAPVEEAVPGLGGVLARCLRATPEDRWPSAGDLGQALARLRTLQRPGPSLLELLAQAAPGLGIAGAPTPSSDTSTLIVPVGNLRQPRDRFVGRQDEIGALEALVRAGEQPLLLLLGPGGAGKTRLAIEVARRLQHTLPGGAWAFDLSLARTSDAVCAAVGAALALDLGRDDPVARVGHALAARGRAVVVLDNLEQCVEALPETLGRWVELAPDATFLCTSRVVLGLRGERRVVLEALAEADAVSLFVARASRALSEEERAELPALCATLEGMPLPIELAASRLAVLDVPALRARAGLALLTGGARDLPARHRSVAASLAWSWDLLSPAACTALAQLSVFDGGFTLEAAEAVLDLSAVGGPWTLDVVQELADASLLRTGGPHGRFSLLVVVREFAAGRLSASDRAGAEARHGAWYAQLGAPRVDASGHADGGARFRALALERGNLVSACRRAIAGADAAVALATLRAVRRILDREGPNRMLLALAEEVATLPDLDDRQRAAALSVLAGALTRENRYDEARGRFEDALALHRHLGEGAAEARLVMSLGTMERRSGRWPDARSHLERSAARLLELGDLRGQAAALHHLGVLDRLEGRLQDARARLTEAHEIAERCGHRALEGRILWELGAACREAGRNEEAVPLLERSLALVCEAGDQQSEHGVLNNLALARMEQGKPDEARRLYERSVDVCRATGNPRSEGVTVGNLAILELELGRYPEAHRQFERALGLHRAAADRRSVGIALGNLGSLLFEEERYEEARVRFEEALDVHREVGQRRYDGIVRAELAHLLLALGRIEDARREVALALGVLSEVGDRRFWAVARAAEAQLHQDDGRTGEARTAFEDAAAVLREVGDRRLEGLLRTRLGTLAFEDGRRADARSLLEEALGLARSVRDPKGEAIALRERARAQDEAGRATADLEAAAGLLRSVGARSELALVLVASAERAQAQGDAAAAAARIEEAAALSSRHDVVRAIERIRSPGSAT